MKVGILTLHYHANFGAVLQAHALQTSLCELDCDVRIVNYVPSSFSRSVNKQFWRGWGLRFLSLDNIKKRLLQLKYNQSSQKIFDDYRNKYMTISHLIQSEEEFYREIVDYDCIVVGSDQVWNLDRPGPYMYWQHKPLSVRKIAYAACCTSDPDEQQVPDNYIAGVKQYDAITVRDNHTVRIVTLCDPERVSAEVCDPTLLAGKNWPLSVIPERDMDTLLFYGLGLSNPTVVLNARQIYSEKISKACYVSAILSTVNNPQWYGTVDEVLYLESPTSWCERMASAGFVVTDSFHGAVFCMKYNTPFIVIVQQPRRASRILDFVKRYDLEDHLVTDLNKIESVMKQVLRKGDIDFSKANAHIEYSKAQLKNLL